MRFEVTVDGCDDATTAVIEGDDAVDKLLDMLSKAITAASTYGCMPRMTYKRLTDIEEEDA
jgi:hypothetical protein